MSRTTDAQSEDDVEVGEAEDVVDDEPDELTTTMIKDIAECFAIFDKTKNKTMEVKYFKKALLSLGIGMSVLELQESRENLESEGVIEFEQFKAFALDKLMRMSEMEALTKCFQNFDPDNEGMIVTSRFKRWMMTMGNPLTDKEAKEFIRMCDAGAKGYILYDDVVSKLTR